VLLIFVTCIPSMSPSNDVTTPAMAPSVDPTTGTVLRGPVPVTSATPINSARLFDVSCGSNQ
jgi:hypothetical protein